MCYKTEGSLFRTAENQRYISSLDRLREAMEKNITLEARAVLCSSSHDLKIELPCAEGIIEREEGAVGIAEGRTRDIAIISRVNKIVCFKVKEINKNRVFLSRTAAQRECMENYINKLSAGDVIDARVTHLEQFGCFVDIGCGISSLIPIDMISVSRISHPSDRFSIGENIKAVVKSNENGRIFLTHKELLGTWEENAACFETGQTVSGIVRSVEEYGIFVELAPNLAGFAEIREGISAGQPVSVYIKAVLPDKMKIKLIIVDVCDEYETEKSRRYFFDGKHIDRWTYTPPTCEKLTETVFGE